MAVTKYYWDELSDNVLMEVDENGDPTAVYTNEPGLYGELVSQERGGVESFYHFDGQGSTRELTDAAEAVTDEYTYTAFGETVAESGETENPFRYKGALGYYAGAAKSVYVRARHLTPQRGRWLSCDPANIISDFIYVENSPLDTYDPSGLFSQSRVANIPLDDRPPIPVKDTCGRFFLTFQWQLTNLEQLIGGVHNTARSRHIQSREVPS